MAKILSTIFLIAGFFLLLFTGFLWYQRNTYHPIRFTETNYSLKSTSLPQKLVLPSINAHLDIFPSVIKNNQWQTTGKGVSYLSTSPLPGKTGNSVMYGHNWKSILGDLPKVKPGDEIIVVFGNNTSKHFVVTTTAVVNSDQASIIMPTKDNRLTIYTCTGFLDTKRFVVVAFPTS